MAKRLTVKQKEEISLLFSNGANIEEISNKYKCTKLTIARNLKKTLGEEKYKVMTIKQKSENKLFENSKQKISNFREKENIANNNISNNYLEKISNEEKIKNKKEFSSKMNEFIEIAPLNCEIDNLERKDLCSVPILEVTFPKILFMIVDKKVELQTKYLQDYPKWQFLSKDELKRKTIEVFSDLKIAKGFCGKEQKVIKVPNTDIFKIVAPILLSRGISRIISSDKLIAL